MHTPWSYRGQYLEVCFFLALVAAWMLPTQVLAEKTSNILSPSTHKRFDSSVDFGETPISAGAEVAPDVLLDLTQYHMLARSATAVKIGHTSKHLAKRKGRGRKKSRKRRRSDIYSAEEKHGKERHERLAHGSAYKASQGQDHGCDSELHSLTYRGRAYCGKTRREVENVASDVTNGPKRGKSRGRSGARKSRSSSRSTSRSSGKKTQSSRRSKSSSAAGGAAAGIAEGVAGEALEGAMGGGGGEPGPADEGKDKVSAGGDSKSSGTSTPKTSDSKGSSSSSSSSPQAIGGALSVEQTAIEQLSFALDMQDGLLDASQQQLDSMSQELERLKAMQNNRLEGAKASMGLVDQVAGGMTGKKD